MEIREKPRQTGKTYDIAQKMLKQKETIIIIPTLITKKSFCKEYGIALERVITMKEAIKEPNLIEGKEVYIDEVGCCLQTILPKTKIIYGTHTSS